MPGEEKTQLEFRPRARIIRTIGDQLISGPEAALIELAKNAYDADASFVTIKFYPPLTQGLGRIHIVDDGHGMALTDIRDKWMEPATTAKAPGRLSPKKLRPMMGSKGIGRFAAAKLGTKMALRSTTKAGDGYAEVLIPEIDWSDFNGETYLSDVRIDYLAQSGNAPTGTEIEVEGLNEAWSKVKMQRLILELRRLVSPIDIAQDEKSFRIYLDLSECNEDNAGFDGFELLATGADPMQSSAPSDERSDGDDDPLKFFKIRPFPLLKTCDYEVEGHFDKEGTFVGTMQIRRAGRAAKAVELRVPYHDEEESPGEFGVHLFLFDRELPVLKQTMVTAGLGELTAKEARKVLDDIAGIAIYRNGFRIRPYGDPENDWLTLDKRRVLEPSVRVGHGQVAGYVRVEGQDDSGLVERSSREGFEQNAAFRRLTRLVRELLTKVVEPTRYDFRASVGLSRKGTTFDEVRELAGLNKIRELIAKLPKAEQVFAEEVIDRESTRLVEKIEKLEDRQRVLESKSSLGSIIGEVLHEGAPSVTFLLKASSRLQRTFPDLGTNTARDKAAQEDFPFRLNLMVEESTKLSTLFVNLRPLSGGKRGVAKYFRPIEPISKAVALFSGDTPAIKILGGDTCEEVIGYPEDLSTAMVNLLNNAVYWLGESKTQNPKIDIYIENTDSHVVIVIDDNGPGIARGFADHIFEVGFSLKDEGTGLGLNIAREALARSDGSLAYHEVSSGGARFEIKMRR